MTRRKTWLVISLTVITTFAICTVAAMYTTPRMGHAVTLVSVDGGSSRHPVMLGLNEESYVVLVTGVVRAPFKGNARIVLEGDPHIKYKVFSRNPPLADFGVRHFCEFRDDTLMDLKPGDKYSVILYLRPDQKISRPTKCELRFFETDSNKTVFSLPIIFRDLVDFDLSKDVRRPYTQTHRADKNSKDPSTKKDKKNGRSKYAK